MNDIITEKQKLYNEFYNYLISDDVYNFVILNIFKHDVYKTYHDSPCIYSILKELYEGTLTFSNNSRFNLKAEMEWTIDFGNRIKDTESFNYIKYIYDYSCIRSINNKFTGIMEVEEDQIFKSRFLLPVNDNSTFLNNFHNGSSFYIPSYKEYKRSYNNCMSIIYPFLKNELVRKIAKYTKSVDYTCLSNYDVYFILKYLKSNSEEISKYFLDLNLNFNYMKKMFFHYELNPSVLKILGNDIYRIGKYGGIGIGNSSIAEKELRFPSVKLFNNVIKEFEKSMTPIFYNEFKLKSNKKRKEPGIYKSAFDLLDPHESINMDVEFAIPYIEHFNTTLIIDKIKKNIKVYIKNEGLHKLNIKDYIFPITTSTDFEGYSFKFESGGNINKEYEFVEYSVMRNIKSANKDAERYTYMNLNIIGILKKEIIDSKYNTLNKYIEYRSYLSEYNKSDVTCIDLEIITDKNLDIIFNSLKNSSYRSFLLTKYKSHLKLDDMNYLSYISHNLSHDPYEMVQMSTINDNKNRIYSNI